MSHFLSYLIGFMKPTLSISTLLPAVATVFTLYIRLRNQSHFRYHYFMTFLMNRVDFCLGEPCLRPPFLILQSSQLKMEKEKKILSLLLNISLYNQKYFIFEQLYRSPSLTISKWRYLLWFSDYLLIYALFLIYRTFFWLNMKLFIKFNMVL